MSKIAKNYAAFHAGVADHDKKNPDHNATGIGLAPFDMDRLGFDEGETLWGGITVHGDRGVTGNFRVICDGHHFDHDKEESEEEVVDAVSSDREFSVTSEVVTLSYSEYMRFIYGVTG